MSIEENVRTVRDFFETMGSSDKVTGASSSNGLGIARKMVEEGAAVGINYGLHQELAEKLAAEIRAWGGKAAAIGADVSRELVGSPCVTRLPAANVSGAEQRNNRNGGDQADAASRSLGSERELMANDHETRVTHGERCPQWR